MKFNSKWKRKQLIEAVAFSTRQSIEMLWFIFCIWQCQRTRHIHVHWMENIFNEVFLLFFNHLILRFCIKKNKIRTTYFFSYERDLRICWVGYVFKTFWHWWRTRINIHQINGLIAPPYVWTGCAFIGTQPVNSIEYLKQN